MGPRAALVYLPWTWLEPVRRLKLAYGESGLTWGILLFYVMIPYIGYFVHGFFRPRKDAGQDG